MALEVSPDCGGPVKASKGVVPAALSKALDRAADSRKSRM